ncbi:MAG: S-methyl-5-thioribose-1-phosphate isomerase, partial [Solirubrobacteraceae bacterium]
APLIGVAAAYGVAIELARDPESLDAACALLVAARPTAANLAGAVKRVREAAETVAPGPERAAAALRQARALEAQERAASEAIARHGADLLTGRRRPLTHCNTGALATPGRGTALAVIAELALRGGLERVLVCETRPLLQGARLTAYELDRLEIEHAVIVDGAGPALIAAGEVDAVVVGCDRVAANGDVANKVGTYAQALAAAAAAIPFVVAGPTTTIDPGCPSGAEIAIEQRDENEVLSIAGSGGDRVALAPLQTRCLNPAFDVTPAALVTALVTERGIASPSRGESVLPLLQGW